MLKNFMRCTAVATTALTISACEFPVEEKAAAAQPTEAQIQQLEEWREKLAEKRRDRKRDDDGGGGGGGGWGG